MVDMILNSIDNKPDNPIAQHSPFRFNKTFFESPTKLEIEFIADDQIRYNYSFSFNGEKVIQEALLYFPKGQKRTLFVRDEDSQFKYGDDFKTPKKAIEDVLLPSQLFFSKAAISNHPLIVPLYKYFNRNFLFNMEPQPTEWQDPYLSTYLYKNRGDNFRTIFDALLSTADSSISKTEIIDFSESNTQLPSDSSLSEEENFTNKHFSAIHHDIVGSDGYNILPLFMESRGTRKMYDLAGKFIEALEKGMLICIDELDSSLHPMLSQMIFEIFQNPKINRNNAQLLVSTHDATLLTPQTFRRDQVWFTEKDKAGSTELYSLDQFGGDKVRSTSKFGDWYLSGRFGALPRIPRTIISRLENAKITKT